MTNDSGPTTAWRADEQEQQKAKASAFDGNSSSVSTCPTGSNRSVDPSSSGLDKPEHGDEVDIDVPAEASTSCLSFATRRLRRRRLRGSHARVPLISATSLFNRLQTSGVVLVDCRKPHEFATRHLPDALHCPPVHTGPHLPVLSCTGRQSRTVDDVLELVQNPRLSEKLARRDLMEVVVIGGNHSSASLLYKMDWGYRFARLLLNEGRVFSVRFLAQGFPAFAKKYGFLLSSESPSTVLYEARKEQERATAETAPETTEAATSPTALTQYPNEIVDGFLFLGNFWQANSAEVIDALQITHVVNMGAITDQRNKFQHVEYLDVAIKDNVDVDIAQEFAPTIEFIQKAAEQRGRVLIHCVQGVSRSSTIVIWYVMLQTKCTLSAAYSHVLKCRPLIFPNRGFMAQLIANERQLYGDQSVEEDELELLQHGLLPPIDRSGSALSKTFL
ncbi:hypothetical protein BBJ28_00008244 [Nothophytophthora sp. Chile5]|nr:hypothetical protein BBJ28_00008244 [Nothophytophthora sp. Chile5]